MGIAAPGGGSSLFKGLSHALALRPWLNTVPASMRERIDEPPRPGTL